MLTKFDVVCSVQVSQDGAVLASDVSRVQVSPFVHACVRLCAQVRRCVRAAMATPKARAAQTYRFLLACGLLLLRACSFITVRCATRVALACR